MKNMITQIVLHIIIIKIVSANKKIPAGMLKLKFDTHQHAYIDRHAQNKRVSAASVADEP